YRGRDIKLWDVANGKDRVTLSGHKSYITSLTYSPDGQMLASGDRSGAIKLWDVRTKKERANIPSYTKTVHALAFSADGKILAAGHEFDLKTRNPHLLLWNTDNGKRVAGLTPGATDIRSLAFSPKG